MSPFAAAGWILGTILILVIGFSTIFGLRKILAGRPKAAAGLANLHPAGRAIARVADIDVTREQVLLRYVKDCQNDGDLAAAKRWGDRIAKKRADKSYAEIKDTFSDDEPEAEPVAEGEPAEEEAEPAPRPRRTRATS